MCVRRIDIQAINTVRIMLPVRGVKANGQSYRVSRGKAAGLDTEGYRRPDIVADISAACGCAAGLKVL